MLKEIINYKLNILKLRYNYDNFFDKNLYRALKRDGKLRNEIKRNLVQVTSHGGVCPICQKWEKKILNDDVFTNLPIAKQYPLLSEAIKSGLFHKGCRHGLITYYPELEGIEDETEEEYQADIEYINNKIDKLLKK